MQFFLVALLLDGLGLTWHTQSGFIFAGVAPMRLGSRRALWKSGRGASVAFPPDSAGNLTSPADFLRRYVSEAGSYILDELQLRVDMETMIARARGGRFSNTPASVVSAELPSSTPTYEFAAEGDPMIVVYDQEGNQVTSHHYYGPAAVLFFNKHGHLDHIDFVGVCDSSGGNRQSPIADYVGEHARLYVQSGTWKYRNGCGKRIVEVSDRDWVSERAPDWRPDSHWLRAFTGKQTFVVHALQPRVIKGSICRCPLGHGIRE